MKDAEVRVDAKPNFWTTTNKKTRPEDDGGEGKEKEKTKKLNYFEFRTQFQSTENSCRTTNVRTMHVYGYIMKASGCGFFFQFDLIWLQFPFQQISIKLAYVCCTYRILTDEIQIMDKNVCVPTTASATLYLHSKAKQSKKKISVIRSTRI